MCDSVTPRPPAESAVDSGPDVSGPCFTPPSITASGVVIVVCETCRLSGVSEPEPAPEPGSDLAQHPRAGALLAAETERLAAASGVTVRRVSCLSNCKRGLSAAIVSDSAWTYVFGDLTLASAPDLLCGAALLAASTDGLMPFRPRPQALKRGMIARIPNMLSLTPDLPSLFAPPQPLAQASRKDPQ